MSARFGRTRAVVVPLALAVLTFLSAAVTGAAYYTDAGAAALDALVGGRGGPPELSLLLGSGTPFAVALLTFFLAHEAGHWIACRIHGVSCTPPYFLPAPLLLFGTFGAVIRVREPIPDRRVLFDIGIAGPLAGLPVALAALVAGLARSADAGLPPTGAPVFGHCILSAGLAQAFGAPAGAWLPDDPLVVAGWIGLIATAMNLFPAGQLDGGHVVYAMTPHAHPVVGALSGAFLASLVATRTLVYGDTSPWLLWAVVVLLIGRRHPPVIDPGPSPGPVRTALGVVAAGLFVLLFMPHPIAVTLP